MLLLLELLVLLLALVRCSGGLSAVAAASPALERPKSVLRRSVCDTMPTDDCCRSWLSRLRYVTLLRTLPTLRRLPPEVSRDVGVVRDLRRNGVPMNDGTTTGPSASNKAVFASMLMLPVLPANTGGRPAADERPPRATSRAAVDMENVSGSGGDAVAADAGEGEEEPARRLLLLLIGALATKTPSRTALCRTACWYSSVRCIHWYDRFSWSAMSSMTSSSSSSNGAAALQSSTTPHASSLAFLIGAHMQWLCM